MSLQIHTDAIRQLIADSDSIVIMQADNPDGDSLGSALALEQILGELGKETFLYCGVEVPSYLRHMPGWDRVSKEIPPVFDASIIVDTSAIGLFEKLTSSREYDWVQSRPCLVIDHHAVESSIPFATHVINMPVVATGEIIYELALVLDWPLNESAQDMIAISILSDSLGLTSEATTPRSIHIIGELAEKGVNLAELENRRRQMMRKSPELVTYKGQLLQRIELHNDNSIATVTIPWEEIEKYSHAYNPSMLVMDEMRLIEGTNVAIAFKTYPDGRITGKVRCNYGYGIAADLAAEFGGGGHTYASGFKVTDGTPFDELKSKCINKAVILLKEHKDR